MGGGRLEEDDGGEGGFGLDVAVGAAEHDFNSNCINYLEGSIKNNFKFISFQGGRYITIAEDHPSHIICRCG